MDDKKRVKLTIGTSQATEPRGYHGHDSVYRPEYVNSMRATYSATGTEVMFVSNARRGVVAITPMDVPIFIGAADPHLGKIAAHEDKTIRVTIKNTFSSLIDTKKTVSLMKAMADGPGIKTSNTSLAIRGIHECEIDTALAVNSNALKDQTRGKRNVEYQYLLDVDKIAESPNGYLDAATGYLFVLEDIYNDGTIIFHPNGHQAKHLASYAVAKKMAVDVEAMTTEFKLVDNSDRISALFGYYFGHVARLDSVRNPTLKEGLHVRRHLPGRPLSETVEEFYTLEEAMERFKFFRTSDEAESNGNPEKQLEYKLKEVEARSAEAERQLEESKREFDKYKLDHEKEKLEHDRVLKELQVLQEKRTHEHKERSMHMEQQSADKKAQIETYKHAQEARKENADVVSNALKLCGIVVGAVVSLIGIFKVFF